MGFLPQPRRRDAARLIGRARDSKPSLPDVLLGTGAFVLAVAACLYFVAQLGS